jgi:hypothetical protein
MKITAITLLNRARFIEHYNNPEQMVQFTDDLFVDYSALDGEDHSLIINAFVNDNGFKFVIEDINNGDRELFPLNQTNADIFEFISEITAMIVNRDYDPDILAENRFDLVRLCLQKTTGDLADRLFGDINMEEDIDEEVDDEVNEPEYDPNNIYLQMLSGQIFTIPRENVNWEENLKNIEGISNFQGTIKQMIFDMYSAGDDQVEIVKDRIREAIKREQEGTGIVPDYSRFEGISDKELLLIQLFDLNTVYEQMILLTSLVKIQNEMMGIVTAMNENHDTPVEDLEDKIIAEDEITQIEEVPEEIIDETPIEETVEEIIEEAPVEETVEETPVEEVAEEKPEPEFSEEEKQFLRTRYGIRFPGDEE